MMKWLNLLLNDFTTLFSSFYASLFLYSEMGREEGKKMRSELALAGDSPYAYIYTRTAVAQWCQGQTMLESGSMAAYCM